MKKSFTLLLLLLSITLAAQHIADFENIDLPDSSYLKDAGPEGGFISGPVFLPNQYTDAGSYDFWDGWVVSNLTDTLTAGFSNEGSAFAGGGAEGSRNFAIAYAPAPARIILTDEARGRSIAGMYVTNTTYTALSMRDGDSFAKVFGGETGDDPDYLLLTIRKWQAGNLSPDSVNFYLADYRFEDNSQDYIVKEWTWVDLTSLGPADSLQLTLYSTDVGDFGINTPAYFCIDQLEISEVLVSTRDLIESDLSVFPNPADDHLVIKGIDRGAYRIYNIRGQLVRSGTLQSNRLEVKQLRSGAYVLEVIRGGQRRATRFVKR